MLSSFPPGYGIGKAGGTSSAIGLTFAPTYGEKADFVSSGEQEEGAPQGRV
ncbi:hypothetical protein [Streptomyces griseoflavus]|uniref:hypothetical protein n=1 Tax=Streptomyces griseoflavus TaxID=35619 RepID=UPI0001B4B671|nr:hypothetical protein [Streptomyces griseoflavus]